MTKESFTGLIILLVAIIIYLVFCFVNAILNLFQAKTYKNIFNKKKLKP